MATIINVELQPIPPRESIDDSDLELGVFRFPRVPAPKYRHSAPSAPWPWMDFNVDPSDVCPLPPGGLFQDPEWSEYPQSLFGNWTRDQVDRSRILMPTHSETCSVHIMDVFTDGKFACTGDDCTLRIDNPRDYWNFLMVEPPSNIRVRALFVENMTVPILQILGTKYNIDPSFYTSAINWIPSRYQEDPKPDGDHITVILPFIRLTNIPNCLRRAKPVGDDFEDLTKAEKSHDDEKQTIDTRAPLLLPDGEILLYDLLAIHMHRTSGTSTIISYHSASELQRTSARRLQSLVQRTGDSVYWQKIYARSRDPTFVFLTTLWYAFYAWDEALEELCRHVSTLESRAPGSCDTRLIRELHELQAHLLCHQRLLRDFQLSVKFVKDIPNPAMSLFSGAERSSSADLLRKEACNLESEVERLSEHREILSDRVQNIIHLAFAITMINDNRATLTPSRGMSVCEWFEKPWRTAV